MKTTPLIRSFFFRSVLLLPCLLLFSPIVQGQEGIERNARVLTNLLDYIGQDYAHAVEEGEVINEFEYEEMQEFSERARERGERLDSLLLKEGKEPLELGERMDSLEELIGKKASTEKVFRLSAGMKKKLLGRKLMTVAPEEYPDLENGKALYVDACAECHGEKGNGEGPQAEGLEPPPTNLREEEYMKKVAPLKVFNTARLGIEGTSMRAFDEYKDQELWDIAFYVLSMQHQDAEKEELQLLYEGLEDPPSLEELSLSPDQELLKDRPEEVGKKEYLAALRRHEEESREENESEALQLAGRYLDEALVAYQEGKKDKAREKAISAYLDGVEPVEKRIGSHSSSLVDSLETAMFGVREGIRRDVGEKDLTERVDRARETLSRAEHALGVTDIGYWGIFLITASIILREGLEAFLIIVAILSVLRSVNARAAANWVHAGWLLALAIGGTSWFFTDRLLDGMGMRGVEVMEGFGALTAVVILLFVGFWMHNRSEISKWKDFIENRIHRLTSEGNMVGLAFLSFIVVFREAFESVIFLSAIRVGASEGASAAIPTALITSLAVVFILAHLALRYSQRLPIRSLFRISSIMLAVLAVILVGKGIHAFQETDHLSMTGISGFPKWSLFGIYPTWETLLAQLLTIALCIVLWVQGNKPLKKRTPEG